MGKIDYFTIRLNKPNPVYTSGETLFGTVNLKIKERFKINSVNIVLLAFARVHWSETKGSGKTRYTVNYSSREDYMNFSVVFISKNGSNDLYLEVGEHSYPFEVVLSKNLPTSFEHTLGRIRYSIKGNIDIPWAFDKHTTKTFSVINQVDLNLYPSLQQTYGCSDSKILCCCCCKSDPINAQFSIMKTSFVPGEGIVFNASIDNQSNKIIKKMTVSLYQRMKFRSTQKTKIISRKVAEIHYNSIIMSRCSATWNDSVLTIPSVCPSSNNSCKIIDISYDVIFNFDASGLSISTDLKIPILIGTIPFRNFDSSIDTSTSFPISYEACMFGPNTTDMPLENESKGEVVETDEKSYRPFYPYYKNLSKIK